MPKLVLKYREVIEILENNGFTLLRQKGSHKTYIGKVGGQTRKTQVCPHKLSDDVPPKTLASIIRQSGLDKSLFDK